MKTQDGRPARLGSMFFEEENHQLTRKYCTGHCNSCGKKQGLSNAGIKELASNMPGALTLFFSDLRRLRIRVPN